MTFLERTLYLIEKKGITKNKLLTDLGLSKNSFVDWSKRGSMPSIETISKIADYFHVSADYLLGRADTPSPAPAEDKELSKIDIMISTEAKDLSDKDKQEILYLIQYKKRQNTPASPFQSSRTFTTADLEDGTARIAAFGGIEENDDEPLTT